MELQKNLGFEKKLRDCEIRDFLSTYNSDQSSNLETAK